MPDAGKSRPRLIMLTVLEPVLAMMVAPVASSMATPVGFVPVEIVDGEILASGAGGLAVRSIMVALPLPLLATTARPWR